MTLHDTITDDTESTLFLKPHVDKIADMLVDKEKPVAEMSFSKMGRYIVYPNDSDIMTTLVQNTSRFCEKNQCDIMSIHDSIKEMYAESNTTAYANNLIGIRKDGVDYTNRVSETFEENSCTGRLLRLTTNLYRKLYVLTLRTKQDDNVTDVEIKLYDITDTEYHTFLCDL